jgi:hypothetical protein
MRIMTVKDIWTPGGAPEMASTMPAWYRLDSALGATSPLSFSVRFDWGRSKRRGIRDLGGTGMRWIRIANPTINTLYDLFGILDEEAGAELEMAVKELRREFAEDLERRAREIWDDSD